MYLLVQSAEKSPSYLTDKSLEFLKSFRQQLVDLPADKLRYILVPDATRVDFSVPIFVPMVRMYQHSFW